MISLKDGISMKQFKGKTSELNLSISIVEMGADLNVMIMGGEKPHIGAVAIAIPHVSLSNPDKVGVSTSLMTVTGHKEDDIARTSADFLARSLRSLVVVTCGIHSRNLTKELINKKKVIFLFNVKKKKVP